MTGDSGTQRTGPVEKRVIEFRGKDIPNAFLADAHRRGLFQVGEVEDGFQLAIGATRGGRVVPIGDLEITVDLILTPKVGNG